MDTNERALPARFLNNVLIRTVLVQWSELIAARAPTAIEPPASH
jgi:hypothetical protein